MDLGVFFNLITNTYIDMMTNTLIEKTKRKFEEIGVTVSIDTIKIDYDYIKAQANEQHDKKIEELQKKVEENSKITSPDLEEYYNKVKQDETRKTNN